MSGRVRGVDRYGPPHEIEGQRSARRASCQVFRRRRIGGIEQRRVDASTALRLSLRSDITAYHPALAGRAVQSRARSDGAATPPPVRAIGAASDPVSTRTKTAPCLPVPTPSCGDIFTFEAPCRAPWSTTNGDGALDSTTASKRGTGLAEPGVPRPSRQHPATDHAPLYRRPTLRNRNDRRIARPARFIPFMLLQ